MFTSRKYNVQIVVDNVVSATALTDGDFVGACNVFICAGGFCLGVLRMKKRNFCTVAGNHG